LCSARLIGYPTEYRSAVQTSVHKARRDVLRQQLTEDELKAKCYWAAKEQAEKTRTSALKEKKWQTRLTDEERATIEKGIEEIAAKFRNGETEPDVKELFNKIHLTEKEISSIITAAKKRNVFNFSSSRKSSGKRGPVKKIKRNIHLQPDSVYERSEFEPHETELLNNRCVGVAARLKQCEQFPADLTIPPLFSTASAYRVFESSRISLSKRASVYFNPSDMNSSEFMVLFPEGDIVRRFAVHDRLNIQLHSDILTDINYLKLKTQVRAVLLEPTRLAMAIESPVEEERRNQTQMELMQAIMAEQEAAQKEPMLDLISHEVVVENTQENEPIFYEDAVDDALNATIHTVMDKIRSDEPEKKKRGRRTNRDRWLAEYQALERDFDEREQAQARRRHLPARKARNLDALSGDRPATLSSGEDDEPDIDVVGPSSTSACIGDVVSPAVSETGLGEVDECMSTTAEVDSMEFETVAEVLGVGPPKRKRGRPKKSVVAEFASSEENQNCEFEYVSEEE
ncbi:hypothetical protein COOONC_02896, partial [Cooperia oncophora]